VNEVVVNAVAGICCKKTESTLEFATHRKAKNQKRGMLNLQRFEALVRKYHSQESCR